MRSSCSGSGTTTARVFPKTMPRLSNGTGAPPMGQQGEKAEAQLRLGLMNYDGEGVPKNNAEAVKWFRLSAEQGNAEAQLGLGILYEQGLGVPEDYVLAYAWYNLASAQGNEQARDVKDDLRTRMTPDQIAQAQETSATLFDRIN